MKNLDFLMMIAPQKPYIRPFDVFYPFSHQQDRKFLPILPGPLSILGILNQEFEVRYHDLSHFKFLKKDTLKETIENIIKHYNPKVVGMHTYTFNFNGMKESLKYIKAINENIITVAGGQHVSFLDNRSIEECNGNLDVVVRGEGEKIIYNLMKAIENKRDLKEVRGITTKDFRTDDEQLLSNEELNSLPSPLFEAIPEEERRSMTYFPINCSRGCSYRCLFCVNHQFWGGGVRILEAKNVIKMIKDLFENFDRKKVFMDFTDTILPLHLTKYRELVELYVKEINQAAYFVLTRANYTDSERLKLTKKLLKDVGVLSIGIENGNERVLKLMHKPSWNKQVEALRNVKKANIKLTPTWLVGHPGENLSTMVENLQKIDYLFDKGLINTLIPFIWVPLPGTPPFEDPKKYNVKIVSFDWDRYDRAIYLPPYHLMESNDYTKVALSNQQIWSYFLSVISLCNKNSTKFGFKSSKKKVSFNSFLKRVKTDPEYTLFNPSK
ncbi:MAG: radical SAM protein, partial [Candidatus Lokiarchaeota archaeon]|nr:radical SAM protein [Candidatus Lokiarchaeota archaeon]